MNGDVPRTMLEIGGGFDTLGEALGSACIDGLHYIDIDKLPDSRNQPWGALDFAAQYARS